MKNLATLEYWTEAHGEININLNENDFVKKWISENFVFNDINSVFEVGCYPGKYLTIFGDQGIEVNGVDFIPNVIKLSEIFTSNNYKVGRFYNCDFFKLDNQINYDCVVSLGFIEHFENWEKAFTHHFQYINEGGYLIIEVPNFNGFFQRIPRFLFDYKNFKKHNLKAMNLKRWNEILIENNFEIIYSNHFGGYNLWFEVKQKSRIVNYFKKIVVIFFKKMQKMLFNSKTESIHFSCAIGIIAKKKWLITK